MSQLLQPELNEDGAMHCLSYLPNAAVASHHKCRGLKQHSFITLRLYRAEIQHGVADALLRASLGSEVLASMAFLLGSNSFPNPTSCWQNSVLCNHKTDVPISLTYVPLSFSFQQQYVLSRCFDLTNPSVTSLTKRKERSVFKGLCD